MAHKIGTMPHDVFRGNSCSRCANADGCIDTDIEIPYEGGLAICRGCIADIAVVAGFDIDDARLREALARATAAEAEAADLRAKLTKIRSSLS